MVDPTNRHPALDSLAIEQLFARQVERTPDAPALVYAGGSLSYRELELRSNRLAHRLHRLGGRYEERVGVCLPRSPELVIAMLAVLKAGGAYLASDPAYPTERVQFMLRDGGVRTLLTLRAHAPHGAGLPNVIQLDDAPELVQQPETALPSQPGEQRLAYVCYTSGSTGVPKGVEVTHQGVVRLVHEVGYVPLDTSTCLLHAAPAAFDATTFEIWGALLRGGRVALFPAQIPTASTLREFIAIHRVNTAFLTTALVNAAVDEDPRALSGLSHLLFGGEAVSVSHIAALQGACPDLHLVHVYGPTETTTFATAYPIRERVAPHQTTIPIGRAIEHTSLHLLDAERQPVPTGELAELYIGGRGVARGYLGRPELTAERFVSVPDSAPGELLYRTGDLVRMLPSGDVVFAGRVDHQVKIRGHRIELGEIESRLALLDGVKEAVVLCREDHPGDKRLVAYVVPARACHPSPGSLRERLARELPEYMVPRFYVRLPRFALTSNGKIDRKQLAAPGPSDAANEHAYRAPRREVEVQLTELWQKLLAVEPIGVDDDFFALGGHSLLATRLLARIRERFCVELPLSVVFERRTVGAIAPAIEAALYLREGPPVDATCEEFVL